MRELLMICAVACLAFGCTNDGVDLSKTDAASNNNNTPDGSNNTPDGSNNTPDGSNNIPDGSNNIPDGSNNIPDGSNNTPDASVPDAEVQAPTFTEIQAMLMNKCGACHTDNEFGGLKLADKSTAYGELVGVAVEHQTTIDGADCGNTRVVANDAANSVIIQRLRGTCSNQMPKARTPLTEDEIQMIEDWINDGAQNN